MIATIISNHHLELSNITVWEETLVAERFSASRPTRRYIDDTSAQGWDGVYRKYNGATKRLARPFLGELRALCDDKDLIIDVYDAREPSQFTPVPIEEIDEDFLPGIKLKQFQIDAIKKIYKTEVGIIGVKMGGGKGELIAGFTKAMRCPTVIIAEQIQVITQLRDRLKLRDVCEEPGLFYAGKMPTGQVVIIGSIQSLVVPKKPEKPERGDFKDSKTVTAQQKYERALANFEQKTKAFKSRLRKSTALHALIGKCEMLIVDEADLAVSDTYKKLFRYWFHGRRRYGMTGTPEDPDKPVENLILKEHLGSIIVSMDSDSLVKEGLVVPIEYVSMVFGEGSKEDARAYDIAVNELMVYNKDYHRFIAAMCKKFVDVGTLILVERDDLGYALKELIPDSDFIHGKTPKTQRPKILKAFEERRLKVLIGGKNVRRGLDLKGGCQNLILATGGKRLSEFDQQLGRARRLNIAGKARVYDFFFLNNKYLYGHSRKRVHYVVEMGLPARIVFSDGIIEAGQFVRSRFRRPRFRH